MVYLLLILPAIFLAVRFDVPTQIKMGVTNLIYGDEMRGMKGFRVVVEALIPELEKEGLTRETLLKELSTTLEKGGIRALDEVEWQKTSGKPVLTVTVNATKTGDGRYQYSTLIEVGKSESPDSGAFSEKVKTLWLTSGMGEGGLSDIRAMIKEEAMFFIKSHAGS
jgi:hypothetical protein